MHILFAYTLAALVLVFAITSFADRCDPAPAPKFADRMPAWSEPVTIPARVVVPLACGAVYCENTRRWRDPVTKRFVKQPVMEASAGTPGQE